MPGETTKTLHELNLEQRRINEGLRTVEEQALSAMKGAAMRMVGGKNFRRERKPLRADVTPGAGSNGVQPS